MSLFLMFTLALLLSALISWIIGIQPRVIVAVHVTIWGLLALCSLIVRTFA
jgi:hypothetical protein